MLKKRSISIAGHATSLSLEDPFWQALKDIAKQRDLTLPKLVEEIDEARIEDAVDINLSGALRVYCLEYYRHKDV